MWLVLLVMVLAMEAQAALMIVCTTPDLASIARSIAGNHGQVFSLAKPTEDPHFVDAKPSFIARLNKADLLIEGGAELESGWLDPLVVGARNSRIATGGPARVSCAKGIQMLNVPSQLDRSQGDVHAAGNPHYMMDPVNALIASEHIGSALSRVDGAHATEYQRNRAAFEAEIKSKLRAWEELLSPYKGQHLVAYHNTWPYFAKRFGLKSELFLEPKPGIPPTPTHLNKTITTMKSVAAKVIAVEPYQSRKTAEKVATESGAQVLEVAQYPGGFKGSGEDYISLMDSLVKGMAKKFANH